MKKLENTVSKGLDLYNNPAIRGLVETIKFFNPAISIADGVLLSSISDIKQKRMEKFFKELQNGHVELTEEIINSNDFLHKYMITLNVVSKTNRKEKIEIFAMLFKSSINNEGDFTVDLYEEYLNILDELSYRELYILAKLYKYEEEYPLESGENDLQRCNKFWEKFINEIKYDLNIDENEIDAILTRMNRTGCYKEFKGTYWDYTGGKGKLTPIFNKIQKLISSEH